MPEILSFANRLQKNFRHLRRWAGGQGLGAYRVYDRDIPEFPCSVDWYEGWVHVLHYPPPRVRRSGLSEVQSQLVAAIGTALNVPPERTFVKTHLPMRWGKEQYPRLAKKGEELVVSESGLKLWVNLGDYLDSGLFLDQRLTRARLRAEARGKRFLNLFCYTGAFTVFAAAGGAASTTSVDLSSAYLKWAERNLELNHLEGSQHRLIRADVLQWIEDVRPSSYYDLIVLDPPSFSISKRMQKAFEVQRDHPKLLEQATALLANGGSLYFSTNFQGFRLQFRPPAGFSCEELTPRTIPQDFRQKQIHRCWLLQREARPVPKRPPD